jgi:methionyl aminopeptidase
MDFYMGRKKNKSKKKNNTNNKTNTDDIDELINKYCYTEKDICKLVLLNKWESENIDFKCTTMLSNTLLAFDKTLNKIKPPENVIVPVKIQDMRRAAEVHRQARKYIQNIIKPGMSYLTVCESIENKIRNLFNIDNCVEGIGFPTGFSVNNIAAHDSALPNDKRIIKYDDVIKVDFGTHRNGNIIDSAFTVAFNPVYEPLLKATYDATWTGIKLAGPDVLINDISKEIQEVIESYELTLNNKTYPLKAITNLGGHTIEPYKIHGGKLVLCAPSSHKYIKNMRMEAGECFAIETFATTGTTGYVNEDYDIATSHYMINPNHINKQFTLNATKKVYNHVYKNRKTLPFCTRWLHNEGLKGYNMGLKELESKNVISSYPPLVDKEGTYTSQFEHTIYIHEYGKEVLSHGDDY